MKDVRPTTGKVKLALFNILGDIREKSFLDLFSGTGQIAKEALARGARPVVAVESDRSRAQEIKVSLKSSVFTLYPFDVRRALAQMLKKQACFDAIYADPPYELGWGRELPLLLQKHHLLIAPKGSIIIELSIREKAGEIEGFEREERVYGQTVLHRYTLRGEVE